MKTNSDIRGPMAIARQPAAWRHVRLLLSTISLDLVAVAGLLAGSGSASAQTNTIYSWTNFAGQPGGGGNVDGTNSTARFSGPQGMVVDSAGNVFVADTYNNKIRKVTPAGVVTTLAGSAGSSSGTNDGTGSAARFYYPQGVAMDSAGNVYVADLQNSTIRKITSAGVVTTLAGSAGSSGTNNGTGSAARFDFPCGVAVDSAGNVFVADTSNNTIRKVTPAGVVTTLAGSAGSSGTNNGTGSAALFSRPGGVAVDSAGNVIVADTSNNTIRKVTPAGVVTTLAGSAGSIGTNNGTGSAARFYYPQGVAVDSADNVVVADTYNNTIRKVTPAGVVTTLAGSAGPIGWGGYADGTGGAALFSRPSGVAVDSAGNVYVADGNSVIRKVSPAGSNWMVTTLAGNVGNEGWADGTGSVAQFSYPEGLAMDSAGNIYVADMVTIRKVTPAGVVTTLAGSAGNGGWADGTGSAARFILLAGVAVDSAGNVFVADSANNTIRKVTLVGTNWVVTTPAGSAGNGGWANGTNSAAQFITPQGMAADSAGNVFVTDASPRANTIRKVTPVGTNWVVTTPAGRPGLGTFDGTNAGLFGLNGVVVDSAGNLFVAENGTCTIRKISLVGTNWVVTTLAGSFFQFGSADGTGSTARFYYPSGVAMDSAGNLYVTDSFNNTIRKVSPMGTNWVVTTIGGTAGVIGGADGIASAAQFSSPNGIAVDSAGILYVSDSSNSRIIKGTPLAIAQFSAVPTNGVALVTVSFTDTSTGPITNRSWNFGDGSTSNTTATSLTHDYSCGGSFTVSLTVFGLAGPNTSTQSNLISVTNTNPPLINVCAPAITNSANASCQAAVPDFTGAVQASANCTASNTLVDITQVPVVGTLVGPGVTTVTVTVRDAASNATTCATSFVVRDSTLPTIAVCAPPVTAVSDGAGHAAMPDFTAKVRATDNCTASNLLVKTQMPRVGTVASLGTTPVTITVSDAAGTSATCDTTFTVVAIPVFADFTAMPTNGRVPLVVAFSNLSTGATATTAWDFGDGSTSTEQNPSHTYTNPATFNVRLTVTGPTTTYTLNRPGYITVQSALPPVITGGPSVTNALVQLGNLAVVVPSETNVFLVTAMDPGGNPLSYQWQFGDGVTNAVDSLGIAMHAYLTNCGPYAASVTIRNSYAGLSSNLTAAAACALNASKPTGKVTATVNLNPAKTNLDTASLVATLDLGAAYIPFTPARLVLTVNIGGAQLAFPLDKKGHGVNGKSTCQLTYTKPTRTKLGFWRLTATFSKGNWSEPWSVHGLVNQPVKSPGNSVVLPVVVIIGNEAFAAEPQLHYTASENKTGTAK